MTFLNPLLLFGLAAAALPLLIHLLNLRKLKTVQFSSLRFLRELQKTQIRRFRIRQILLLIVRTLLIIMIVLAFSRPALRGSLAGGIGSQAASTMMILLDDSPSMGMRNERGIKLHQAKEEAEKILALKSEVDQAFLIRLSEIGLAGPSAENPADATVERIRNSEVSQLSVPFSQGISAAGKIMSQSGNPNREVFLISDGQLSQFEQDRSDSTSGLPERAKVFFVRIPQSQQTANAGISAITTTAQVISPDRALPLDVGIRNGGTLPVDDLIVSLYLDGARVAQQSVSIEPGQAARAGFRIVPRDRGIRLGYAEIDSDALEADNRRYFVLTIPQRIRVGLVGAPKDTRFAELALSAARSSGGGDFFALETIDEERLASVDFSRFDVIALCNFSELSPSEGDRMARYVGAGGGLLLFPGPRTDCVSASRALLHPMGIPALSGCAQDGEGGAGYSEFGRFDLAHPLFQGLFEEASVRRSGQPVESPRILRHMTIRPGLAGNVLIELQDGTPFLVEYPAGTGRVLLFALDAGMEWSDFPLRAFFAPLLHRTATYLGSGPASVNETLVGSAVRFQLRLPHAPESEYRLLKADAVTERIEPRINPVTGLTMFETDPARAVGHYIIAQEQNPGVPLGAAAVNLDERETDLRIAGDDEIAPLLGLSAEDLVTASEGQEIEQLVTETRSGVELWRHCIIAAIILALCEMGIARFGGQKPEASPAA